MAISSANGLSTNSTRKITADQKLRRTTRKFVLRRAMAGRLPRTTLTRRKRGFNAPVSLWMRHHLADDVAELLRPGQSTLLDTGCSDLARLWSEPLWSQAKFAVGGGLTVVEVPVF